MFFSTAAFILWIILPIPVWILTRSLKPEPLQGFLIYVGAMILGTVLYVGGVVLVGLEYEHAFMQFDLNGDGTVDEDEWTPEADAARQLVVNDTGRCLTLIVAPPVTFAWMNFWLLILYALSSHFDNKREDDGGGRVGSGHAAEVEAGVAKCGKTSPTNTLK